MTVHLRAPLALSNASTFPLAEPTYTVLPALTGDDVTAAPVCAFQISAPVVPAKAYRFPSLEPT